MVSCFTGCIIAALFAFVMVVTYKAPLVALVSLVIFPVSACWMSGIKSKKQLCKIVAYIVISWIFVAMLKPSISETAASRSVRLAKMPLLGYEWYIITNSASTLFACVGAFLAPPLDAHEEKDKHKSIKAGPESA
jgi:hypothetical protein